MGTSLASPALAGVLQRRREELNARFRQARLQNRGLDEEAFRRHLLMCVDPLATLLSEELEQPRLDSLFVDLYDLSLTLVSREFAGPGARHPWITMVWCELLPDARSAVVTGGADFVAAMCNAIHNVAGQPGADPHTFLLTMIAAANTTTSADLLLEAGRVAAWRSGLAFFRDAALAAWRSLPDELRRVTLAIPDDVSCDEAEAHLADDPWSGPDGKRRREEVRLGGFVGFGGPFAAPPEVETIDGRLYATDGRRWFAVDVDAFGATVRPLASRPEGRTTAGRARLGAGKLTGADGTRKVDYPEPTSQASTNDTLAATRVDSHFITLWATR